MEFQRAGKVSLSSATVRRLLFLAAILLVPLPLFVMVPALVPVARFFELAVICWITIAIEGTAGVVGLLSIVMLAHALVYATLLWIVTGILVRLFDSYAPRLLLPVAAMLLVAGILLASISEPYATPFADTARAGFPEVYR